MILAAIPPREGAAGAVYTCDPALTRLFTPPQPLDGTYEACAADQAVEVTLAAERQAGARFGGIEALEALDAFGAAGTYRRAALARLYGGTRVRVARGWSAAPGRFESITLLSPYPDASLSRLVPGTMVIRWTRRS